MLVVKRMLIVSYKLENIGQVELNKIMELMYDLHVMYIFVLVISFLLCPEKNNEFH
jgi:hypothetical protein